ncbi:MAG: hypothetical protein FJZ64_03095 [Chlamydiae bacterium]|nr:hypothetical protein [Chlamydiota bacterium]
MTVTVRLEIHLPRTQPNQSGDPDDSKAWWSNLGPDSPVALQEFDRIDEEAFRYLAAYDRRKQSPRSDRSSRFENSSPPQTITYRPRSNSDPLADRVSSRFRKTIR